MSNTRHATRAVSRLVVAFLGTTVACASSPTSPAPSDDVRASPNAIVDSPVELPDSVSPAVCDSQPWASGVHTCGTATVVSGRHTCADLGFTDGTTLTIDPVPYAPCTFPADCNWQVASLTRSVSIDGSSFDVDVSTTTQKDGLGFYEWFVASHVNADATTAVADALVFARGADDDTVVIELDPAEFYIRNILVPFVATSMQVCGYHLGRAASPPPPPDTEHARVECGFPVGSAGVPGSSAPPGSVVSDPSQIRFEVKVTPPPQDGSLLTITPTFNDSGLGTQYLPLVAGQVDGTYENTYLDELDGTLELQFRFGASAPCSLFWHLVPSGGQTW